MTIEQPTGPTEPVVFTAPVRKMEPPQVADERETLEGWLDYFRSETILALDGLTEYEMARRVPETGLSLLAVVKHLTELERTWLVERWGERGGRAAHAPSYVDDPDAPFRISGIEQSSSLVGTYQATCERGRDALAAAESLDDAVRDDRRGHIELRWILLHLITETARHAGKAQTLRDALLAARVEGPVVTGPPTPPPVPIAPAGAPPVTGPPPVVPPPVGPPPPGPMPPASMVADPAVAPPGPPPADAPGPPPPGPHRGGPLPPPVGPPPPVPTQAPTMPTRPPVPPEAPDHADPAPGGPDTRPD